MKNIGVKTAAPVYLTSYLIGFMGEKTIFYNSLSFEFNIWGMVVSIIIFLSLTIKISSKIGDWNIVLIILSHLAIGHFFNSTMIRYMERMVMNDEMTRDGLGLSWIILLPLGILLLLICGTLFDRIRKKTEAKSF